MFFDDDTPKQDDPNRKPKNLFDRFGKVVKLGGVVADGFAAASEDEDVAELADTMKRIGDELPTKGRDRAKEDLPKAGAEVAKRFFDWMDRKT